MPWPRFAFVATVIAGCALREITPPWGGEQVVVQGVLNARASEQVLWIERTTPAGDPIAYGLRPLAQPPARAEVQEEGGGLYRFTPDTGNAARFVAPFTPVHGRRYDLVVEAQGAVVRGTTVVPPALTVVDPPADTVSHLRDAALRVSWAPGTSRDVAVYVTRDTNDVSGYVFPLWVRDDTTAVIPGFSFVGPAPTRLVWVVATDPVTARAFAFEHRPIGHGGDPILAGNLTGGAGVFGAVTSDRFLVRLQ
ncbi:MAG: DUF4249 family protein [Gemmatimonadales bacterium]